MRVCAADSPLQRRHHIPGPVHFNRPQIDRLLPDSAVKSGVCRPAGVGSDSSTSPRTRAQLASTCIASGAPTAQGCAAATDQADFAALRRVFC